MLQPASYTISEPEDGNGFRITSPLTIEGDMQFGEYAWSNEGVPEGELRIIVDEVLCFEGRAALVAVANGRYFGGGMCIAPDARGWPNDLKERRGFAREVHSAATIQRIARLCCRTRLTCIGT